MKSTTLICVIMLAFAFSQTLYVNNNEQVRLAPRMLNYQGYLTDTLGIPITNPSMSMTFGIWSSSGGGTQLWYETQIASISKGIFNVLLGTIAQIPDSIFTKGTDRWLELTIAGITLTPRTRIVSASYAFTSSFSDTAYSVVDNAITTPKILDTAVTMAKIAPAGAVMDQVIKWNGTAWAPSTNVVGADADWNYLVSDGADTTLQMGGQWGLARAGNVLYGNADSTHVNFGVNNTTGTSGQNCKYSTISGGQLNVSSQDYATVAGGHDNVASGHVAAIAGGHDNTAGGVSAFVGGGQFNIASGSYATVAGGHDNTAGSSSAFVGGGQYNSASAEYAVVTGGLYNTANNLYTTVGGGVQNTASGYYSAVCGGYSNLSAGDFSAIVGGYADTITETGDYSFLFGINANLTQDSTCMVNMPHIWFGDEENGYEFPRERGADGQFLGTNASGQLSWGSVAHSDSDWIFLISDGADTTLQMGGRWGLSRMGNVMYGKADSTHVNFGVACTTGALGGDLKYCTVGGGWENAASAPYATVCGGWNNAASDMGATVCGGWGNTASQDGATIGGGAWNSAYAHYATVGGGFLNTVSSSDYHATIGGGYDNTTSYACATVGGGAENTASDSATTVGGGVNNTASGRTATVAGGWSNTASGYRATVGGGFGNTASGETATVGGGYNNIASGYSAAVGGGMFDSAAAYCGFATNYSTKVSSGHDNSAAFTTSHTTAADQVRAAAFSTGTLDFAMDHPDDPMNKILNQYGVSSDEVMSVYRGSVVLDAIGRAAVNLPDYFDDINRNPMIQLTGVGSSDVYVAEKIIDNRFVVGGKPGIEVYWEVTGERTDIHAEIARVQTPVMQEKKGDLRGHSIDDDAMIGIYDGIKSKNPELFVFKTDEGRRVHEESKRLVGRRE